MSTKLKFWRRAWIGILAAWGLAYPGGAHSQFVGFENKGLVGVGRLSGNLFDHYGTNLDTLGGMFSGMTSDPDAWSVTTNGGAKTYSGTLYCVPDRGYGPGVLGGTLDYKPRVQTLFVTVTPYYGSEATNQSQITMTNTATRLLLDEALTPFTGFGGNDVAFTNYPKSSADSPGKGHRSIDPEGIARLRDGSFFVCDEYGPFIYKFNSNGVLECTLRPPEAWISKVGATYPRANNFSGVTGPDSGRKNNRGMEGVAVTPDEGTLFALLQSPLVQDGGEDNTSRYTRILAYDIRPESSRRNELVGEYVYELTLNGNGSGGRQTITSEILALNSHQLLVLDRDQRGRNSGSTTPITYKRVVLVDTAGASNILGSGYDLESGAPGQTSFPLYTPPEGIQLVTRQDFINLVDYGSISRYGLNLNTVVPDTNTIVEKWEGLALVAMKDDDAPNDFLLLVGCDNDFGATNVYHNGALVASNPETTDHMLLAYRVTLPIRPDSLPRLTAQREEGKLRVSWPAAFSNYVLQVSTELREDAWWDYPTEGQSVLVDLSEPTLFFRLIKWQ